jgi:hypothetical protein
MMSGKALLQWQLPRMQKTFLVLSHQAKLKLSRKLAWLLHKVIHPHIRKIEGNKGSNRIIVRDSVTNIEANVGDIKSRMISEEDNKILSWLADSNYSNQHNDYLSRRQQGTGQWLLESPEYQDWLSTNKQTLFCPGIPGAGKTILTAIVIENLQTRFDNDSTIGIVYFYYNFKNQDQQTTTKLMASFLRQLCFSQSPLPEAVKSLHDKHIVKNTQPTLKDIAGALQSVVKAFSRVFIAIDALDECRAQERSLFLSELFKLQAETNINIFVTSRPILDIKNAFQGCISLDIVASQEDIEKYFDGHMSKLPKFVHDDADLKERIKTSVTDVAQGMLVLNPFYECFNKKGTHNWPRFLLAQLYLGILEDKVSPKAMKQALTKFQCISLEKTEDQKFKILQAIYDDTMTRIKQQKPGFCHLATSALSWLSHAKRQLKTLELQHALAVNMELDSNNIPEKFDDDSITAIELIVSSCHGLVTVDEESDVIRLVHYTTQEYFDRTRQQWFPEAETAITNVCTLYLTMNDFYFRAGGEISSEENRSTMTKKLQLDPFFGYACVNWGHHARGADSSSQLIHEFLVDEYTVKTAAHAMRYIRIEAKEYGLYDVPIDTALELTAYFGAVDLMKKLPSILETALDAESFGNALYGPLYSRHSDAIRLLLGMGADVGTQMYGYKGCSWSLAPTPTHIMPAKQLSWLR